MSLVLYPHELKEITRAFDEVCAELTMRGSKFSREQLAAQMLSIVQEWSCVPEGLGAMLTQEPRPRYLH